MKNKQLKQIQKAAEEATNELEQKGKPKYGAIKDFLEWLEIVKSKLLKHMN